MVAAPGERVMCTVPLPAATGAGGAVGVTGGASVYSLHLELDARIGALHDGDVCVAGVVKPSL